MNARIGAVGVVLLSAFCVAAAPDRPEKEKPKNSIIALFDGIPKDLAVKVKDNPVRCDRVNDWLQEHVNGKGKAIEIRVEVKEVLPYRKEGAYFVSLVLNAPKINLLGDDWRVHFGDGVGNRMFTNFGFEGVNAADAEKLVDSTHVKIQAKVRKIKLPRFSTRFSNPEASQDSELWIVLEDVQVDGKKWTTYLPKVGGGFGGGGGFPGGGGGPFGGGGFGGPGGGGFGRGGIGGPGDGGEVFPPGGAKKKKGGGN